MESSGKFTSNAYTSVYQTTTEPLKTKTKKPPRRDKSDLGEDFIAPDDGWAWLVCIAAGISNLSIYPCVQQFGFIFKERLENLGLSSSQVTTIINTNPAVSACTGLLNGPMFRRFTFRQVALTGALLIFVGIMLTAFCETFIGYIISFALLFGFGMGISVSASSLAINTYFKKKRRKAAGFSWTITGIGPIILPHLVTFLVSVYGVQGTVFIFAALSLHAVVSALIYQPVQYHVHKRSDDSTQPPVVLEENLQHLCKYCELQLQKQTGIFSSQYLYQDDDEDKPGFEIIEPGTPMLSRANDGWYGSKMSLASSRPRHRTISTNIDVENWNRRSRLVSEGDEEEELKQKSSLKPNNFNREREKNLKQSSLRNKYGDGPLKCTCAEERALMELNKIQAFEGLQGRDTKNSSESDLDEPKITFLQKVVAFFDLSLLRDFTFVNLVMGLTIINFGELNFSILTPFILSDFGFETSQMTLSISLLAGLDITTRFLMPFFTEKIPWDNRVFFLIGVVGIALGRTVVACTRSFSVILVTFAIIGVFKGIRTIFWPLIIPSCVPLKRLPAASGLQLLISGLFTLAAGPFVGLVRDRFNYAVTLHCLNAMTFVAAISWTTEAVVRRYLQKPSTLNCD
uniref:Major facilitator superfamily (MFS) profile domain-containing protein n=1 Tax=Stomoxys calcitrans TaxID=35570 RepID=A0A1I8P4X9_STOCA